MSSESANNSSISFPNSLIKAPGALLKDKKDPFLVRVNRDNIQNLLETFKTKAQSPFCSFTQIPNAYETQSERLGLYKEPRTLLGNVLSVKIPETVRSPGKLKNFSEKICEAFTKAKDILAIYGIDLVVEDSKISQEIYNLLKILIPEICFFPSDFFTKLKINKVILCKRIYCESCSRSKISLQVHLLDSKCKVRQRLYKIIFDHLVLANSEIFRFWREIEEKEDARSLGKTESESLGRFEEAFMGLMNNTNHALLRPTTKKLRELLANYYPEAMSEERFKNRNKEKKKMFRVRFETEPS